jgi:hypothetical protein
MQRGSFTARRPKRSASEDRRYEGVVASAVMRAVFPKDAARRAFLKQVGASTALAAISQFFPLKTATEVFAQGGAIEKKDLKVGFIRSPAPRRSSWRIRWASIPSTASTSKWSRPRAGR